MAYRDDTPLLQHGVGIPGPGPTRDRAARLGGPDGPEPPATEDTLRRTNAHRPEHTGVAVLRATVLRVLPARRVEVTHAGGAPRPATVAAAGYDDPAPGDSVLVLDGATEPFVVGVLERSAAARAETPIRATDAAGTLLFEHFPAERRSVVHVRAGDLELRAPDGSIELVARDDVRVRGGRRVQLSGPELEAVAARASVHVDDGRLVARRVATVAQKITVAAGVVETSATRIVERARATYREVEDLAQTRAGRIRAVARTTWQALGRRAVLRGEDDVKILGEKIHLA